MPKGVSEIDIRAPGRISPSRTHPAPMIPRSVTDPSQVSRIVGWFDALKPPGKTNYGCAGGLVANVTFTFRSANGAELARAYSPPAAADPCNPIHFTIRGQQETFLVDSNQPSTLSSRVPRTAFIGHVERLIGTKFRAYGYLG
jgi:hypothetical protein